MLRQDRLKYTVARIRQHGSVGVEELAQNLGVSAMTVRRDLDSLSEEGLLYRVHGGAVATESLADVPAETRAARNLEAKQAIAKRASELIPEGTVVWLGGGTTVHQLARQLRNRELTVVTDSILVLEELGPCEETAVHVLGGTYRHKTRTLVGPATIEQVKDYGLEWAFLGASAVSSGAFYNYYPGDTPLQRAVIDLCEHPWVLVDGSKIGAAAVGRVAGLDSLDGLVVDETGAEALGTTGPYQVEVAR